MKILAVYADAGGCGYYRMILPYETLRRRGHEVHLVQRFVYGQGGMPIITDPDGRQRPFVPDVMVFQRPGTAAALSVIQCGVAIGVPVIVETDDLLWHVPWWNPSADLYQPRTDKTTIRMLNERVDIRTVHRRVGIGQGDPPALEEPDLTALMKFYASSQGVIVTCEALAKEVQEQWPGLPCFVAPNCLSALWHGEQKALPFPPKANNEVRIGWAGSHFHKLDLREIRGVPAEIMKRHPNVKLVLIGGYSEAGRYLAEDVDPSRVIAFPWMPLDRFPMAVRQVDIGLAPLAADRFNLCKSDLKAKEYGVCGIPVVASEYGPYPNYVIHEVTGFLCKTREQWIESIEFLVTHPALRKQFGEAARKQAKDWDISRHIDKWESALMWVIEDHARRLKPRDFMQEVPHRMIERIKEGQVHG